MDRKKWSRTGELIGASYTDATVQQMSKRLTVDGWIIIYKIDHNLQTQWDGLIHTYTHTGAVSNDGGSLQDVIFYWNSKGNCWKSETKAISEELFKQIIDLWWEIALQDFFPFLCRCAIDWSYFKYVSAMIGTYIKLRMSNSDHWQLKHFDKVL